MIEIACSADAPYLPHVSAMLHSLLTHTPTRPLRVWLIHGDELPAEGRDRVSAVISQFGAQVGFLFIEESKVAGFSMKHFHPAAWYRVLLPGLLPDLDKILYLDCDIIVTDDITPLWETDLNEHLFAAVCNPLFPFMRNWPKRDLGLKSPLQYLNSGVLLMNLAQMRAEGIVEQLRQYSMTHPERRLPEQDAMSDLLRGRWLQLHPRWNAQTTLFDLSARLLPFPEEIVGEALAKPAVIHYNGPFKPWQYLCKHPLRDLYFKHLAGTPWPRRPLQGTNFFYRLIRPLPITLQYSIIELLWPVWVSVRRLFKRILRAVPLGSTQGR